MFQVTHFPRTTAVMSIICERQVIYLVCNVSGRPLPTHHSSDFHQYARQDNCFRAALGIQGSQGIPGIQGIPGKLSTQQDILQVPKSETSLDNGAMSRNSSSLWFPLTTRYNVNQSSSVKRDNGFWGKLFFYSSCLYATI